MNRINNNILYWQQALKTKSIVVKKTQEGHLYIMGSTRGNEKVMAMLLLASSNVQSVSYLCDDFNYAYQLIKEPLSEGSYIIVQRRISKKRFVNKTHNISFTTTDSLETIREMVTQLIPFTDYSDFAEVGLVRLAFHLHWTTGQNQKLYFSESHNNSRFIPDGDYKEVLLGDEFFRSKFEVCDLCNRLLSKEFSEDIFVENCPSKLIVLCEECHIKHIDGCQTCSNSSF